MRSQRKAGWIVLLGLLMTFAICVGTPAGAANPILPHRFYGNVTISDLPAPNGTHITAVVTGGSEDYTTIISGEYGTGFLVELFKVQPQGDSTIPNGAPITFFINDIQAEVYEVGKGPWMASFPFKDGGETNLDLRIAGTQYTISATAGDGGTISPSGSVLVLEGADKTFTITPNGCHRISDVLVNGGSVGAVPGYTFFNVTTNQTISALFEESSLSVTASAGPGGSINPSGVQTVVCGGAINFTINPETGYLIDDIVVDSVSQGVQTNWSFLNVTMNHTISASFIPVTYNITATAGTNGNISPSGTVLVNYGDDLAFSMLPDPGYRVDQILVDGGPVAAMPVYTFLNVTADHTISVSFVEGPPDYFTVVLGDDWNLFSTPINLASGHRYLEDIFTPDSLDNIEVILAWDGSEWYIPGYGYEMEPLDAVYVKVDGNATAIIYPSTGVSSPPIRNLNAGLNLIAPAPAYESGGFPSLAIEDALVSIYTVQGGLTGYTIVVSPGLNQPGWAYIRDGSSEDMLPYKGYWVVMENPGVYAGFSTTPI
jgi:hypothetical protein